ncbi:hypothetical protein BJ138DRAFT_1013317, partial [Hygrophoropsis aurantiaca]
SCNVLVLVLSLMCGVSRARCGFVLAALKNIVDCTLRDGMSSHGEQSLAKEIPHDLRTVLKRFDLDPRLRTYISCPSCFCLYDESTACPDFCTFRSVPSEPPCSVKLKRTRLIRGTPFVRPIRKFLHQDMRHWLGRFLARADIEIEVQKRLSKSSFEANNMLVGDIWDGDVLRTLKGPDGSLFIEAPGNELRLVFSLGVDGFNPSGMKIGKGSASSTENMYLVGVIPGPKKPSLEQINHSLRPLVDDLLAAWDPGMYFSRTALHRYGRRARSVVIPLVCDIMGARQAGGFPSPGMTLFCSFCLLTKDCIESFDVESWKMRVCEDHRAHAEEWRDANSLEERTQIFNEHGVRYSELLRLPYWNPVLFTVLDSMHSDFLLKIHHHVREIWGIDPAAPSGEGYHAPVPPPARPSADALAAGLRQLKKTNLTDDTSAPSFSGVKKPVLWHICQEFDLRRAGTTSMLTRELLRWGLADQSGNLITQALPSENKIAKFDGTVVLGKEVLEEIWADQKRLQLPSFATAAPPIGAEKRTPTADHWRSIGMIHLVITLPRIWGADRGRKGLMLQNYMHLVWAIRVTNMRTMSDDMINAYDHHYRAYFEGLLQLYKEASIKPVHHMGFHNALLLRAFGPTHSWRAWAFERFNYCMQNINTNSKFGTYRLIYEDVMITLQPHIGELEMTFMNDACRAANIPPLLLSGVPSAVRPLWPAFQKAFRSDVRGTRLNDILSSEDSRDFQVELAPNGMKGKQAEQNKSYAQLSADHIGATVSRKASLCRFCYHS